MGKIVFFNHGGSGNHGCEAIVRSLVSLFEDYELTVMSDDIIQDEKYLCDLNINVVPAKYSYNKLSLSYFKALWDLKIHKNYFPMDVLPYVDPIKKLDKNSIGISIGGDVYCYEDYKKYILIHKYMRKHVKKTMLIGCSIEPDLLKDKEMLLDLKSYDLISARESITYNALISAGLDNVIFCPDSAFLLNKKQINLPKNFVPHNTIGLNISPLVLRKAKNSECILDNYRYVISKILLETDASIALIPHVEWFDNDDIKPLSLLYNEFKYTNRVSLIQHQTAESLKYVISQCSFFIGARTHATIAAYSSGIPTLVVGYSVKSKGLAKDLFGMNEKYVVSYQSLTKTEDLYNHLEWIMKNENNIKEQLNKTMGDYASKFDLLKREVKRVNKRD